MRNLKLYFAAHRTFVITAGGLLLVALVLLLFVALPARSAASEASTQADRLTAMLKSSEGSALSASARRQLEGEVEALKARVAELDKATNPPKSPATADKVTYGDRLAALGAQLDKAASDQGLIIENEIVFPKNPEDDLPLFLTKIEIAQKVLARAVAVGVHRIRQLSASREGDEFFTSDMLEAGGVKRTMVVIEVTGPMDTLAKLVHSLQQKDGFLVVPRARLWREKPEETETSLKIAVGGIEVSDAKATDKGGGETGGFIFGR